MYMELNSVQTFSATLVKDSYLHCQLYPDKFDSAVSNRSRNLLNDANRSAIPYFPATKGRSSINAASNPFYY